MNIVAEFERRLGAWESLIGDAPVVVGVSGGADSLALLHLFTQACSRRPFPVHAVHVNHTIRGLDSDADAAFVQAVAEAWNVPCHIERVNVPALAAQGRLSLEEAARQARYSVLARQARIIGAQVAAVAHNADDQAETVLMHLIRGTGPAGLRGMLPLSPLPETQPQGEEMTSIWLIRPLLAVPRAEIETYCAAHGLEPRLDLSNLDTGYLRNRLRYEILPLLETINPNVRRVLSRTAEVVAADYEIIQTQADAAWQAVLLEEDRQEIHLDRRRWQALPLAMQRATIRRAVWELRRHLRDVSYRHVEDALMVARHGNTGAQATLPAGLSLLLEYDSLVVTASGSRPAPDWPHLEPGDTIPIPQAGLYELPGSEWSFTLQPVRDTLSREAWQALLADPWAAPFSAEIWRRTLVLRTRQPGDRFRPTGLGGTRKVSDFMIDQKIPARQRSRLPLLVSGGDVAWVCGWRVDERFAASQDAAPVWVARFERMYTP